MSLSWSRHPFLKKAMKKEDFLNLYKGGQRDFPGVDLSGMNLGNENLSNINLSGAILRKTDLCATNLENANLQNSDLREVELSADCHGHGINFSGANFEGNGMYEGIIEKANFSQCNFINSSFGQFLATECNFSKADFTNSWLSETDFSGGNFNDAVFGKTYIDITFFDADITGADFSHAFFHSSPRHLLETRGINNANFTNAIFFVPRPKSLDDLDTSTIHGAICVHLKSDLDKLILSDYNDFAVERMMNDFATM